MFKLQPHQLESLRASVHKQAPLRFHKALSARGVEATLLFEQTQCRIALGHANYSTVYFAESGLPSALELPAGSRYNVACHSDGKLKALEFPNGEQIDFSWSSQERIQAVGRKNALYRFEYDTHGHPTHVHFPDGSSRTQ